MTSPNTELLDRRLKAFLEERGYTSHHGGGSGDDGMEARVAKLEALAEATKERMDRLDGRMDRLDVDIRMLMKVMAAGFVVTWAAGASAFLVLGNKIDTLTVSVIEKLVQ